LLPLCAPLTEPPLALLPLLAAAFGVCPSWLLLGGAIVTGRGAGGIFCGRSRVCGAGSGGIVSRGLGFGFSFGLVAGHLLYGLSL